MSQGEIDAGGTRIAPSGQPRGCSFCGAPAVRGQLQDVFKVYVCHSCRASHEGDYSLITKSAAKEEFLLTDKDLASLSFVSKPNPQNKEWSSMRLYLRLQVKALSDDRYGDGQLELEKERQLQAKFERAIKRRKKESETKKDTSTPKAQKIAEELARADEAAHVHSYEGDGELYDEEAGIWKKTCACGMTITYEKL